MKMEVADSSGMLVKYLPDYKVPHHSRQYSSIQSCVNSESLWFRLAYNMLEQIVKTVHCSGPSVHIGNYIMSLVLRLKKSAFCLHGIFMYFLRFSQ
jgi:hypothetical protein